MTIRSDLRSIFELRPSPPRLHVALQGAIAIGIPAVGFALADRPELGLLASSGAFLALYLTTRSRRDRATKLPFLALGFLVASALGIAASASPVLGLVVLFVVAAASAVLCLGLNVGPPGALFFVLVAGVSGHVAGPTALDGGNVDGALVLGMLALGLVIAYLVVLAPLALPRVRASDAKLPREPMRFEIDETIRTILTRLIIATGIAVLVAAPLGIHRAYWVVVAVVAILQNGHRLRLTGLRGVHRVLGTIAGLGLFALISLASPSGVWLALMLMALQFVVELVVIRNYGLALVFITPLALTIASQAGTAEVDVIVGERFSDTLLGAVIATVVLLAALGVMRWKTRGATGGAGDIT
jgi:hypothetical protein